MNDFLRVGFTHHSEILAKEKSLNGRLFYISRCAVEFWSVEALKSNLRGNLYALDKYVKQEDENPSIGILLCKKANKNIIEFAVRDYTKPMGVATYRTRNEMPQELQKALPDIEDMKKLLESTDSEQYEID